MREELQRAFDPARSTLQAEERRLYRAYGVLAVRGVATDGDASLLKAGLSRARPQQRYHEAGPASLALTRSDLNAALERDDADGSARETIQLLVDLIAGRGESIADALDVKDWKESEPAAPALAAAATSKSPEVKKTLFRTPPPSPRRAPEREQDGSVSAGGSDRQKL